MSTEIQAAYDKVMMRAFGPPARVFAAGSGAQLTDADGNHYVDLLSGIAVTGLGHGHPVVTQAIASQLDQLGHISNLFTSELQVRLASRLAAYSGAADSRVFFTNSGSEANETAFKVTRLTGRTKVVAMAGSFHGRTMGALALTSTEKYRAPFEPLPGQVEFVPYGDFEALSAAVDDQTAAVLLEPIQGESGVVPAPSGFLAHARELATRHGALLWVDEVQTGMGRCGEIFYHRSQGIVADLITLAKGLGNGYPIGACLANGPASELIQPGMHGNTFGGNPPAAAAGNVVLDVLEDGLLPEIVHRGEWLADQIMALHHPAITEVRGAGLLRGIVLKQDLAASVVQQALNAGWIINAPRPNVIRLAPPFIITEAELEPFIAALPGWLDHA